MLFFAPLIWIFFGIATAMAASNKGRSGCGWFLLGFLLGPFGLIFALLASPKLKPEESDSPIDKKIQLPLMDNGTKKCPQCAELIKLEALKCRYCGKSFSPHEIERLKLKEGHKKCPSCGSWDVHDAYLPDGGFGPWCPHCKRPV